MKVLQPSIYDSPLHVCFLVEWKGGHKGLKTAKLFWANACGGRARMQGLLRADSPQPEHHTVKAKVTATN